MANTLRTVRRFLLESYKPRVVYSARAASTVAGREVFSPAVAFLIDSNHIDIDTVRRLPRTGPRNRLLKGDVLRFLSDPSVLDQSVTTGHTQTSQGDALAEESPLVPPSYYGTDVVVNELVTFVKNFNDARTAKISISDLLTRALYLALQTVPEVNTRWNEQTQAAEPVEPVQVLINRLSPFGISRMVLRDAKEIGGVKLGKLFKDEGNSADSVRGLFSIYDAVLSPFTEIEPPLTSRQTALFNISPIRKVHRIEDSTITSTSSDVLDYLAGNLVSRAPQASVKWHPDERSPSIRSRVRDEIDLLAQPGLSSFYTGSLDGECEPMVNYTLSVDLTVDTRAVSEKTAKKFLSVWQTLLKNPKALL
ncbi:hypothetical protein SpCBS45565_g02853 [Spizellomyces sp. 'palustris']|nr:hypothetical protein SpCBS45565_g02853 [Spizellomyces sp. 'palustris']